MQLDARALADATAEIVKAHVAPLLRRIEQLEARPLPERGEKGEPGERGLPGEPGRDGVGVRDGFLQREGVLILSLSDGTTRDLGVVVGADGKDGEPGKDGKDGEPGKDGRDGFALEHFDIEAGEDGRTCTLKFEQGDVRHTYDLVFPAIIYRDIFKEGEEYQAGDAVTWGGSLFIAQRATSAKPESADSGWRLAVKKGRDGKSA